MRLLPDAQRQTACVVTLGGIIQQQNEAEKGAKNCVGETIQTYIPELTWGSIATLTQQHGTVILNYVAQLIGRDRTYDIEAQWTQQGDRLYGVLLSAKLLPEDPYQPQPAKLVTKITDDCEEKPERTVEIRQNGYSDAPTPARSLPPMTHPQFELTEQDRLILQWLGRAQEIEKTRVNWGATGLEVYCGDTLQAERLSDALDLLLQTRLKWVRIYVGKQCLSTVSLDRVRVQSIPISMLTTLETMPSVWAKQNLNVLKAIPGTVALLSAEPGYRYLALKPEISEGRLNKPIDHLIGQPLRTIDEELWLPRERAIETVLATGENEIYYYSHFWENLTWHFKCTVAKASDNEIMTIVEDSDDDRALWQKSWWRNRVASNA